jgi:excisionase family DNA binding protein
MFLARILCNTSVPLVIAANAAVNVTMTQIKTSPLGLSISQAADELGVSLGTIRRWSDMGYLESYRTPGGQRRFSREHIDRFLNSLERRSAREHAAGVS